MSDTKIQDKKFTLLSWAQFEEAVNSLMQQLQGKTFSCIYGEPRGGLPLAVVLSHRMNIPFSITPRADMLWCDDIIDTGTSFKEAIKKYPDATFCVWVDKHPDLKMVHALELFDSETWVIFPWESLKDIKEDQRSYRSKRNLDKIET